MNPLIKYWRILLLVGAILIAVGIIMNMGVKLGLDFEGGTLYQVELQNPVSGDEISRIASIISQRIDPSGLKDVIVSPVGSQYIMIQVSETDPIELEKIESRIRQQGKFEANLNGEIVFTGDEIKKVLRGDNSYGVFKTGVLFEWSLPFVLNENATLSFKEKTFHQCSAVSFGTDGKPVYECEKTIFFLDKPDALIVLTQDQYDNDQSLLYIGNRLSGIPEQTDIDGLIEDSKLNVVVYDPAGFDSNVLASAIGQTKNAIVSPDLGAGAVQELKNAGFEVTVQKEEDGIAWIWGALHAEQVIGLTEGITNEDVTDISQAKSFSNLRISGTRETVEEARSDLEELTVLLESGSLPTPVKSISKETISPSLGESFLTNVFLMGIIAFLTVGAVIAIRYRMIKLIIPIFIIGTSEVLLNLGFIALTQRPLDLAAFAGLIAAIGTGVDSEIVITDEIIGRKGGATESLIKRAKAALFIIMTSAFTIIGVMGPIVLFSRNYPGLDKLYGFAVVAIVGALIGVFITRPAFTKIIEKIVGNIEEKE